MTDKPNEYKEQNRHIVKTPPERLVGKAVEKPIEEKHRLYKAVRELEDLPVSAEFLNSLTKKIAEMPKVREEKWELKRTLSQAPKRKKALERGERISQRLNDLLLQQKKLLHNY